MFSHLKRSIYSCPARAPRLPGSRHKGPLPPPKLRPRSCLPEHGGGGAAPSGPPEPGEPQGGSGAVQRPPGPVPVAKPAVPGVRQAQPLPSALASILEVPGTPHPLTRRPPDRGRFQDSLLRCARRRPESHARSAAPSCAPRPGPWAGPRGGRAVRRSAPRR